MVDASAALTAAVALKETTDMTETRQDTTLTIVDDMTVVVRSQKYQQYRSCSVATDMKRLAIIVGQRFCLETVVGSRQGFMKKTKPAAQRTFAPSLSY